MALDERFRQGSLKPPKLGTSPGSSRLSSLGSSQRRQQLQQQRSGREAKKPPEPLRRAVADCLSSSAPHPHGNASLVASEAGRTLRDYIANPATIDIAYSVLLEHTLAERDRSPAVVSRCVALLKCYILRYIPGLLTLRQIDLFCMNFIAECESVSNRRGSSWSKSSSISASALSPASNYASPSLVKSISYVRSLVARHMPKLYFPQVSFSGDSGTLRQSLPLLSSLLSRSFTSQLSPDVINSPEPSRADIPTPSALNLSTCDKVEGGENSKYVSLSLIKWRWHVDNEDQAVSSMPISDGVLKPPDFRNRGFLEVGAASLLIRNIENGQYRQQSESADLPDIDQLLQPSTVTAATSFASAHNHLKAITASKRVKPGPHQVWDNISVSTFHPRARPLFQYRYYSEQQPLRLNPSEVSDVIAAVCLEHSPANSNSQSVTQLSNPSGKPTTDVAVSVLIKLVIDMYLMDAKAAASLTLFMLEELLSSSKVIPRVRAFDIILNLGIHAQLLEPILGEDPTDLEESSPKELCLADEATEMKNMDSNGLQYMSSAVDDFESWLLVILYDILLFLVQKEEKEEGVWSSALSCLLYFLCDNGRIWRKRLEGLDIRVVKTLLEISREHSWAEIVHSKLICILTNMFYQTSDTRDTISQGTLFLVEQVDLLGGIDFICLEYSRTKSREEKKNLFLVLLDYILHQVNTSTIANGGFAYNFDEIQPLAAMLILANAPEAFYISIRHGVEGIGEILKRSILPALSSSSNYERISLLLEKITIAFDATLSAFTRLDNELLYMVRITKSYKSLKSIEDGNDVGAKVRFSWSTLHCLLHSERSACRHNGYIWLVELLLFGITEGGSRDICSNIKNLQQQITFAGSQDLNCLSVPLHISLMCGLLKSKHNFVRWGFLFVLEKLLMRCKLLLDENKVPIKDDKESVRYDKTYRPLEIANTLVDMMSCGLALLVQVNETNRINILKMCELLFSQLSLRVLPDNRTLHGDIKGLSDLFEYTKENNSSIMKDNSPLKREISFQDEFLGGINILRNTACTSHVYESASMAALLLRGSATVPIQLVARVPSSVLYWPLIQLAGAATDDIALGIAVGSKGRANLPGASSDIRAALLLLLIGKCTADSSAFSEVGGKDFFRELLDDTDSRVAYYSSAFLLKKMMTEEPEKYQRLLQNLIFKAQQSNNEKLLENPYLQMRGILQLLSDLGAQL